MSEKGLNYSLRDTLGDNENLFVFYDFSGLSNGNIGIDNRGPSLNYAVIENSEPAIDTEVYSGVLVGLGSTVQVVTTFARQVFLLNDKGDLSKSNLQITGTDLFPYSNCSVISVINCSVLQRLPKI